MPAVHWTPQQLRLFDAKGPKGRRPARGKPKPATEFRTHCAVADFLWAMARSDVFWSHLPSGEHRTKVTGGRLKRMGLKPGLPDFMFVDVTGRHFYLELKRGGLGKLSLGQMLFGSLMVERGVPYAVARSFAEAEAVLREWGVLKPEARSQCR